MNGIHNRELKLATAVLSGVMGVVGIGTISPALADTAPAIVAQTTSNEERAVAFVDLIFAEQYGDALTYLHPLLRSGGETALAERAEEFEAQTGEFQARESVETVENVVLVNARFEETSDTIVIIFDEDGLITGVDFPLEPQTL